jgi:hypothetical protein
LDVAGCCCFLGEQLAGWLAGITYHITYDTTCLRMTKAQTKARNNGGSSNCQVCTQEVVKLPFCRPGVPVSSVVRRGSKSRWSRLAQSRFLICFVFKIMWVGSLGPRSFIPSAANIKLHRIVLANSLDERGKCNSQPAIYA